MHIYRLDEFTLWRKVLFVYEGNVVFVTILHLQYLLNLRFIGRVEKIEFRVKCGQTRCKDTPAATAL